MRTTRRILILSAAVGLMLAAQEPFGSDCNDIMYQQCNAAANEAVNNNSTESWDAAYDQCISDYVAAHGCGTATSNPRAPSAPKRTPRKK